MNRTLGMGGSIATFVCVAAFALSMLLGSNNASYLSSVGIALGYVPMACAYTARASKPNKAPAYAGMAFATAYAVLIMIVYYAQLTAVKDPGLTAGARGILDYTQFGLFFTYDLIGYAFMAMSTFFLGLTVEPACKADKALRVLLLIHGVFAVSCLAMPLMGVFHPGMPGGDLIGTLVLEFWCAFFLPVSVLSFLYFRKQPA